MPGLSVQDRLCALTTVERRRDDPESTDIVLSALADTLAVSIAGRGEPATLKALQYVRGSGSGGEVDSWISDDRLSAEAAALVNGVAAHALDYDDVTPAWRGHPSAVFFPALLAIADPDVSSGADLVDAYVTGFDGARWLSRICAQVQYLRGWHTTATFGVVGATLACARLMKLDTARTSSAVGLAVAQAAGLQSNFGTMAKPFHVGFAAAGAVRAASLAGLGVTAACDAIEGPSGFLHVYGRAKQASAGELPPFERSLVQAKAFPNCFATHFGLSGLLKLRDRFSLRADDVAELLFEGNRGSHTALLKRLPTDATEAKFSLEYAAATALLEDTVGLSAFSEERFRVISAHPLMQRIVVREGAAEDMARSSRITLKTRQGMTHELVVGEIEPLGRRQLSTKVGDCLAFGGVRLDGSVLCDGVFAMPNAPLRGILSLLRSATRGAPPQRSRP